MSKYHVFLSPSTLSPIDVQPIPRLKIQELDIANALLSPQVWSQPANLPSHTTTTVLDQPVHADAEVRAQAHDIENASSLKREVHEVDEASKSRAIGVKRSRGPLKKSQTEITVPDTSRRRSTRLGRRTSGESLRTMSTWCERQYLTILQMAYLGLYLVEDWT